MPQRPLLACTEEGTTTGRKQSNGPKTRPRAAPGDGVNVCEPAQYEIRVAGVLDSRWTDWFEGLRISVQGEETVIRGLVRDQAAVQGLLAKVRDLGLCLISVRRLDTGQAGNEAR
jgi:hypothetical protein